MAALAMPLGHVLAMPLGYVLAMPLGNANNNVCKQNRLDTIVDPDAYDVLTRCKL